MTDQSEHKSARSTGGAQAPSLRTCVVTRREAEPDDLIRFVADPQGCIVPDVARKLPGRGVWVVCARSAVATAAARQLFSKSLKRNVNAPANLADEVDRLLVRRLASSLSLANKAGLVVAGFTQVDAAIARGTLAMVLHATDGAEDGCAKLDRRYRASCRDLGAEGVIITVFDSAQLSLAIGRPDVIHAALEHGGSAKAVLRDAGRLARFRADPVEAEISETGPSGTGQSSLDEGHA